MSERIGSLHKVSVVIPAHDRSRSLVRLLRALSQPDRTPPHEVIVVSDGGLPAIRAATEEVKMPCELRLLELAPTRGPGIARNTGAAAATGDILLFIDDDIEPFGDIVAEHAKLHDGAPRVAIGAPRAVRTPDAGFREIAGWAWWEQQFERMRRPSHRFGYDDVFTGILSLPRSFWHSLGGFDTSLRCREDFELGLRLVRSRCAFVFTEAGGGWHHENRSGRSLVRRKRDEGAADVAIARMHSWAFEALPLAREGPDPRADFVRRMAFSFRWIGDTAVAVAERLLGLLEALRMRQAWRRVHGGIMYYSYWRGAARALGSWDALLAMHDAAEQAAMPERRELDVDLAGEWSDLAERIDAARPDALRMRLGDLPLGIVMDVPGREPLRGSHLTSPPDDLVKVLATAEALRELQDWQEHEEVQAPATISSGWDLALGEPIAVTELELSGSIRPIEVPKECRVARILARAWGRPAAWLWVHADNGSVSTAELGAALVEEWPRIAAAAGRGQCIASRDDHAPPISVVVCTRDRTESLARCLDSLVALDYPAYEIVLVDNAPTTDATERLAAKYPVRYIREPIGGLDWARNRGIVESRHDFIAFTDDDVRVDRQWLRLIADAFRDPSVGLVTGFTAPASLMTKAEQIFELAYGGMEKGFDRRTILPDRAEAWKLLASHHLGVGANMAIRRKALDAIGGFDTTLDVGTPTHGGGDLDVFHRVMAAGWVACYEPAALVWHQHRATMDGLARQLYDNGRAFGAYLITRWRSRTVPRHETLAFAAKWFAWLNWRIVRRFLRREKVPLPLIVREIWGALQAPWGYLRSHARDRRLRDQRS